MYPEAYKEWIGIFNDDLLDIWQKERKELQKSAMLLTALQKELTDVQTNLEVKLINLRQQLKYKDKLEERRKSLSPKNSKRKSPKSFNNENESTNLDTFISTQRESPDLFKNINPNIHQPVANTLIDLSLSDEDTTLDGSPTIKRRRRYHQRNKTDSSSANKKLNVTSKKAENTRLNKVLAENSVKTSLFKTPVRKLSDDFSVIESTPEETTKKSNVSKGGKVLVKNVWKKRETSNVTLTQMFGKAEKKLEKTVNTNAENGNDSDETYFEEASEGTKLGITDLLNYINEDRTMINAEKIIDERVDNDVIEFDTDLDSSQEVDKFSKGAIFNETDVASSNEKPRVIPCEAEPVVKGKARKQLQGWACEECKNFYGHMKLSPKELQKKMDECSRHRYKYRPPEETLPGYWDLSIPPEKID